jgi:hypothetical protein
MKVTSSLIGVIYFLAEPCIDEGLAAYCCTCVEHITDRLLVEADEGDHNALLRGEPTDDPDGKVRVERMGDSPELVSAGLPDPLESADSSVGLAGRSVRACSSATVVTKSRPPCFSTFVNQRSNSSGQSTITVSL